MDRNKPFRKQTPEIKEAIAAKIKAREDLRKEVEIQGNKCLNSKLFVNYRDKYVRLERLTTDLMIEYNNPDPIEYAFNMRRMADELRQLRLLVNNVNSDNRSRKK